MRRVIILLPASGSEEPHSDSRPEQRENRGPEQIPPVIPEYLMCEDGVDQARAVVFQRKVIQTRQIRLLANELQECDREHVTHRRQARGSLCARQAGNRQTDAQ